MIGYVISYRRKKPLFGTDPCIAFLYDMLMEEKKSIRYVTVFPATLKDIGSILSRKYIKMLKEDKLLSSFIEKNINFKKPYTNIDIKSTKAEAIIRVSLIRYLWENIDLVRSVLYFYNMGFQPIDALILGHFFDPHPSDKEKVRRGVRRCTGHLLIPNYPMNSTMENSLSIKDQFVRILKTSLNKKENSYIQGEGVSYQFCISDGFFKQEMYINDVVSQLGIKPLRG